MYNKAGKHFTLEKGTNVSVNHNKKYTHHFDENGKNDKPNKGEQGQ